MVKVALVYDCRAELLMDAFACPAIYPAAAHIYRGGVFRACRRHSRFSFFKDKMENPSAPWLQRSRESHHS
jgi:hypothetical protein